MYNKKVIEHFRHPRNIGKIDNADGKGHVGNPTCGDEIIIYIKVKDNKIDDIKFETFGCAAAIASSSITTEMVKGMPIEEAMEITKQQIVDKLGGLPPEKIHCSVLAEEGVKKAIEDYLSHKKS